MAINIDINASSKQNYLGQDVNDAITNSDNPSAINPFLTASQIVGGLPTGAIPSNYVTRMASLEISSPTFEDVPGLSTTVTVTASVKSYCLFSFEASATGADAKVEFRVIVNGETSDIVTVDFAKASNSNGSINFRTTNNLTIGSHVVKVQAQKVNGNKIASLDKGFLFTFALQAPKGETGAGVPIGGTTNQALTKIDGSDYNTQFTTIDKAFVGLDNVDNTSDANKPISTATQTSLDGKQATLVSGTNIKTINGSSVLGSGDLTVGGSSSLDIGTTPIINGTIGRIHFQGVGNVIQQDSGLFWDNVNKRFGVNQPIPTARFHVKAADATSTVVARVENSAGTGDLLSVTGQGALALSYSGGAGGSIFLSSSPSHSSGSSTALLLNINTTSITGSGGYSGISINQTGTDAVGSSFLFRAQKNSVDVFSIGKTGEISHVPTTPSGFSSFQYHGANTSTQNGFFRATGILGGVSFRNALTTDNGTGVGFVFAVTTSAAYTAVTNLDAKIMTWANGSSNDRAVDVAWLKANGNFITLGNVGISQATPTARLHLPAGTASATTAPIKLTAGTNMTTPENGAFEFDGTNLYFTVGGVRKTVTLA